MLVVRLKEHVKISSPFFAICLINPTLQLSYSCFPLSWQQLFPLPTWKLVLTFPFICILQLLVKFWPAFQTMVHKGSCYMHCASLDRLLTFQIWWIAFSCCKFSTKLNVPQALLSAFIWLANWSNHYASSRIIHDMQEGNFQRCAFYLAQVIAEVWLYHWRWAKIRGW